MKYLENIKSAIKDFEKAIKLYKSTFKTKQKVRSL